MCHYKISISTLSGIFDEKVGPFSEFLSPKYDFEGCFGKKWLPFSKNFPKIVDFLSKLGQTNQSIQSSFGLSFVSSK